MESKRQLMIIPLHTEITIAVAANSVFVAQELMFLATCLYYLMLFWFQTLT